ncbi:MAG: ferredoxin [Pseudomonadota bacterium]
MTAEDALATQGLRITGSFAPAPSAEGSAFAEIALIGADGARMWEVFQVSPEARDGRRDPLDRWSSRVIAAVASDLGATALFPFGGPPWQPFLRWAVEGEGARSSPVAMQVSPSRGLWMSYRGALGFQESRGFPRPAGGDPCLGCAAPCVSACPVDAFADGSYDVPKCVGHINSAAGAECLSGCKVRLACPIGEPPPLPQRRFHMEAFRRSRNEASLAASD